MVVNVCEQELEAERVELMEGVMANKRKMQELEANLLHKLTSTEVSVLVSLSASINQSISNFYSDLSNQDYCKVS